MRPCEACRETLLDLRYGLPAESPAAAEEARAHLASCPDCAAHESDLSHLLGALKADEAFPREAEVNWDAFARATVSRAVAAETSRRRFRLIPGGAGNPFRLLTARPAWAAAAALLVTAALGILVYRAGPPPGDTAPPEARAAVYVPEANIENLTVNLARNNTARYLTETRAVLVNLLDVGIDCDNDKVDVSAEKAKAMELLRRQRLVANELKRLPLQRAQDICGDLEHLLLEIASLGDCTRNDEIQTLRDVVDQRQILVRMELLSQELARRGGTSA